MKTTPREFIDGELNFFGFEGKKCLLLLRCEFDNGLHVVRIYMPKRAQLWSVSTKSNELHSSKCLLCVLLFPSQRDKIASRIQNGADKRAQFVSLKYRWQIRGAKHFWSAKFILLTAYLTSSRFLKELSVGARRFNFSGLNLCLGKFPLSDSK